VQNATQTGGTKRAAIKQPERETPKKGGVKRFSFQGGKIDETELQSANEFKKKQTGGKPRNKRKKKRSKKKKSF